MNEQICGLEKVSYFYILYSIYLNMCLGIMAKLDFLMISVSEIAGL